MLLYTPPFYTGISEETCAWPASAEVSGVRSSPPRTYISSFRYARWKRLPYYTSLSCQSIRCRCNRYISGNKRYLPPRSLHLVRPIWSRYLNIYLYGSGGVEPFLLREYTSSEDQMGYRVIGAGRVCCNIILREGPMLCYCATFVHDFTAPPSRSTSFASTSTFFSTLHGHLQARLAWLDFL